MLLFLSVSFFVFFVCLFVCLFFVIYGSEIDLSGLAAKQLNCASLKVNWKSGYHQKALNWVQLQNNKLKGVYLQCIYSVYGQLLNWSKSITTVEIVLFDIVRWVS